jgi:hypothetical protein
VGCRLLCVYKLCSRDGRVNNKTKQKNKYKHLVRYTINWWKPSLYLTLFNYRTNNMNEDWGDIKLASHGHAFFSQSVRQLGWFLVPYVKGWAMQLGYTGERHSAQQHWKMKKRWKGCGYKKKDKRYTRVGISGPLSCCKFDPKDLSTLPRHFIRAKIEREATSAYCCINWSPVLSAPVRYNGFSIPYYIWYSWPSDAWHV